MSAPVLKCYHNGPVSLQLFPFRLFLQLFRWHSLVFQSFRRRWCFVEVHTADRLAPQQNSEGIACVSFTSAHTAHYFPNDPLHPLLLVNWVDAFPRWAASGGVPSLSEENQRALTDTRPTGLWTSVDRRAAYKYPAQPQPKPKPWNNASRRLQPADVPGVFPLQNDDGHGSAPWWWFAFSKPKTQPGTDVAKMIQRKTLPSVFKPPSPLCRASYSQQLKSSPACFTIFCSSSGLIHWNEP